ncbi:MAG: S1 RNA-binding domain-containing protein [Eubacteriales bacterium]|nr:S1 RNA-binding domain-containing protein [Eubacteriales bacterium]MDD4475083.1 S1 RNA-binding domain-containing protein [Eubacteriales bacterium]
MQLEVGKTVKGVVTKITNFGAFVSLEGGKSGMIHISEVSTDYVRDITAYLSEGQSVEAIIINIDANNRIGLSIKKLLERKRAMKQPDEYVPSGKQEQSFEDMMSRFKSTSDEKMSDLKKGLESKRGSGYSKKSGRGL